MQTESHFYKSSDNENEKLSKIKCYVFILPLSSESQLWFVNSCTSSRWSSACATRMASCECTALDCFLQSLNSNTRSQLLTSISALILRSLSTRSVSSPLIRTTTTTPTLSKRLLRRWGTEAMKSIVISRCWILNKLTLID